MKGRRLVFLLVVALIAGLAASCGGGDGEATAENGENGAQTGPQEVAANLVIHADTVFGPTNIPEKERATLVCVLASRFPRNSEIVWRARVVDPVSGQELDDSALASVQVKLADGQVFDLHYGAHPQDEPADFFWTTSFDIPTDYPTGTLEYEIVATHTDGRTATFVPFAVAPSLLTITDEVLETIEEAE